MSITVYKLSLYTADVRNYFCNSCADIFMTFISKNKQFSHKQIHYIYINFKQNFTMIFFYFIYVDIVHNVYLHML